MVFDPNSHRPFLASTFSCLSSPGLRQKLYSDRSKEEFSWKMNSDWSSERLLKNNIAVGLEGDNVISFSQVVVASCPPSTLK